MPVSARKATVRQLDARDDGKGGSEGIVLPLQLVQSGTNDMSVLPRALLHL
jgi:hypothetical protein